MGLDYWTQVVRSLKHRVDEPRDAPQGTADVVGEATLPRAYSVQTDLCPICGHITELVPKFQVPFPRLSPTRGQNGWPLDVEADVPTWIIHECQRCRVHRPFPRPTEEVIDDFYARADDASEWEFEHYMGVREDRASGELPFLDKLGRLTAGRMLLEVGPAGGWLLAVAQRAGWQVAGIEAAPKFQRYAMTELGLDVRLGTVKEHAAAFRGKVDVLVLRDVAEHLWDPVRDLGLMSSMLRPGGWIVVETPNIASWAARLYGLRWRQIVVSHTFYWTVDSLGEAIRRAGLVPMQWSEPRYWDPDPRRQLVAKIRESAKLVVRVVGVLGYVKPSERWVQLRSFPGWASRGRLDDAALRWKLGDQPVLGDVLLCAARKPVANARE